MNRLLDKILSKPQLMEQTSLDMALEALRSRPKLEDVSKDSSKTPKELAYNSEANVGVINISGPLTYLKYEPICGETPASYQGILDEAESLLKEGATTIVLYVDSPGGEAYQCFETANLLRSMADKQGAEIIAYVDGNCHSACFALCSVADKLIVNPMAYVGSVGVVVALDNNVEKRKNTLYVYAGEGKIPFDEEGQFTSSFKENMQTEVNRLYSEFANHISVNMGIPLSSIEKLGAKSLYATDAIEAGYADVAMTVNDFWGYIAEKREMRNTLENLFKPNTEKTGNSSMDKLAELQAELSSFKEAAELFGKEKEMLLASLTELAAKNEAMSLTIAGLEKEKAQEKDNKRLGMLVAAVGEEKAASLFGSLAVLDDAAFSSVVEAMQFTSQGHDKSFLDGEVGFSGKSQMTEHQDVSSGEQAGLSLVAQMIKNSKKAKELK